jgi:lipopolysaccharide transport system ATP-binding protein
MDTPTVGFLIRDRLGIDVFGTNTSRLQLGARTWEAGSELTVRFELTLNLGQGSYSLTVAVHHGATHLDANLDWWDQALIFDVSGCEPPFVGLAALPVRAAISSAPESPSARSGSPPPAGM